MTWFPANNHPSTSPPTTSPSPSPRAAPPSPTASCSDSAPAHGRTTFHWRQTRAHGRLPGHRHGGKFQVTQYTHPDGLKVYDAVDPREAAAAKPVLKKLPSVLEWESKLFGPYPYRAAGSIVDHAPNVGYALETQTRPVYDSAPDLSTLVHESAHQWFGDSVSLTSWKDIWLNEGFATYAEWLYSEQHGGDSAQKSFDALYARPATDGLWAFPPGAPGSGAHIFGTPVYARGAMTLQALRTAVGDRDFFRILRAWAAQHRYGHGTTAQFERLAERQSGKNLDRLFTTWLYTQGKPRHP